ncbi:hypothetical protein COC61_10995 [Priestia megaterium]|uniref:restriction endonuclease subunit S n=1 Tax=Priestia megaterium TaxID=1404 RepID=UPI000BFD1E59|nr:restriction endonuclease subunit S [Priestia megaterium]PGR96896.1 hypothetical protein COC61_10995 [Priestia megaterium]
MIDSTKIKGWVVGRFKEFAVLQRGKDLTDNDVIPGKYPVVKSNGIQIYHDSCFVNPPGVVTGRSGTIGNVFYINEPFWAHNTTLYVKNFKDSHPLFIYYLIQRMDFRRYYAGTTVPTLNRNDIHRLTVEVPSQKSEQKAIAGILSKVDEAIEVIESSIKATERLKKSLMQNLLTGKIKPDGTWRSEEEFYLDEKFGKVPRGWQVKPVGDKSLCNINPNYKFVKGESYDFIPMDALNDGFQGVGYLDSKIVDSGGYTRFRKGDILFAKITPCTENGKVALINNMNTEIGFASTEFIVFSPKETVDSQFYFYLLTSDRVHNLSVSLMEGTTGRQRVPWKVFKNRITAPIPMDLAEQRAIAERLKSIEQSNEIRKSKIQSLNNLKKSLMQNLLTGKVRVDVEKINKLLEKV